MEGLNHTDYEKILELFQAGQYVLAQQLVRKDVNRFADWLADKMIDEIKQYYLHITPPPNKYRISYTIRFDVVHNSSYISLFANASYCTLSGYAENQYSYHSLNNKLGRVCKLLHLKQYNKVKQKLKGVLKTLLLSAIHNKLN